MIIGNGIWIGRRGGTNWTTYWNNQLTPSFSKLYYWWDNTTFDPLVRIKLVYPWADNVNATEYEIRKNTDAYYELYDFYKVKLVNKQLGQIRATLLEPLSYTLNVNVERINFTGTTLKYNMNRGTARGILRAIIQPGTFRGSIYTGMQAATNTDKQEGYYYFIQQAGNYTTLDAGLTGLQLRDIIQYSGGAWHKYTEAEYPYTDTDCYNGSSVNGFVTILELPYGTYNVGIVPSGLKNSSSSGVNISPILDTKIMTREFSIYGGPPNATESGVSLSGNPQGHSQMSTRFRKNGTSDSYEWIPEHASGAQLNYHSGETMHQYVDDVELVGNQTGDHEMTEISEYRLTSTAYACNDAAPSEELMKVETTLTVTTDGVVINNKYTTLIETQIATAYSFMMRYAMAVYNRFVSNYPERVTLPASGNQTNITDGGGRTKLLLYNNTVGGDYENIVSLYSVADVAATNLSSELQSFISTYGADYGKVYILAAQNKVSPVGEVWETEVNVKIGYVADLINKIERLEI